MDPQTINVNVLRRHDPEISLIVDSTSYVVLYRFARGAWSKTGLEGTLFIYQREVAPYFGVFVLNRQSLENFCEPLVSGWDVDLDDGLVIWRNDGATGTKDDGELAHLCPRLESELTPHFAFRRHSRHLGLRSRT